VSAERDEDRGFTVTDRRRFSSETGEAQGEAPGRGERSDPEAPSSADASTVADGPAGMRATDTVPPTPPAEITLSTFIISLSTQALMDLGEIPNPVSQEIERDMEAARQMIDILGMLREKMQGNLEPGEDALFDNVLYDLRMKYVELRK
jgi:hypothetical protein